MCFETVIDLIKHIASLTLIRFVRYSHVTLMLRQDLCKETSVVVPRHVLHWQPFTLWLSNVLVIYSGELLTSLLLCVTPLEMLRDWQDLLLCTVAWYAIYYSPLDCFYNIARTVVYRVLAVWFTSVSMVLNVDEAVHRTAQSFNAEWLPMLLIGALVGSGGELLKPVMCFIMNCCNHNHAAHIRLTLNTKIALLVSFVYALDQTHKDLFGLNHAELQLCLMALLLVYRYMAMIYPVDHYIWLLETKLTYTVFGGWMADLVRMCRTESAGRCRAGNAKFE